MAHTHTYSRWVGQSTVNIISSGTLAKCALNHLNCVLTAPGYTSVLCFTSQTDSQNTTSAQGTLHHNHQYYKLTVDEYTNIPAYNVSAAPSGCEYPSQAGLTTRDVASSVTEALDNISDAIWVGANHYHTYLWCTDRGYTGFVTSMTTCGSGHTNCTGVRPTEYFPDYEGTFSTLDTSTSTPDVITTLPATSITDTTAILNGLATPMYSILCGFEYGYTTSYGTTTWFNTSYSSAIDYFSVGIGGLVPGTGYHFRAMAYDGTDYYYGDDAEFTTTGTAYPTGSKLLKGSLTYDGGGDCSMRFQWGLTTSYGTDTPWATGKTTGAIYSLPLTPDQLASGTYHFRAQARNKHSTASGDDKTFTVS